MISEMPAAQHRAAQGVRTSGGDIPGIANISKLLMSDIVRLSVTSSADRGCAEGLLAAQTPEEQKVQDEANGNPSSLGSRRAR